MVNIEKFKNIKNKKLVVILSLFLTFLIILSLLLPTSIFYIFKKIEVDDLKHRTVNTYQMRGITLNDNDINILEDENGMLNVIVNEEKQNEAYKRAQSELDRIITKYYKYYSPPLRDNNNKIYSWIIKDKYGNEIDQVINKIEGGKVPEEVFHDYEKIINYTNEILEKIQSYVNNSRENSELNDYVNDLLDSRQTGTPNPEEQFPYNLSKDEFESYQGTQKYFNGQCFAYINYPDLQINFDDNKFDLKMNTYKSNGLYNNILDKKIYEMRFNKNEIGIEENNNYNYELHMNNNVIKYDSIFTVNLTNGMKIIMTMRNDDFLLLDII